jgi:hypothetical protein
LFPARNDIHQRAGDHVNRNVTCRSILHQGSIWLNAPSEIENRQIISSRPADPILEKDPSFPQNQPVGLVNDG